VFGSSDDFILQETDEQNIDSLIDSFCYTDQQGCGKAYNGMMITSCPAIGLQIIAETITTVEGVA